MLAYIDRDSFNIIGSYRCIKRDRNSDSTCGSGNDSDSNTDADNGCVSVIGISRITRILQGWASAS